MKIQFIANIALAKILQAASVIKSKNVIPILSSIKFTINSEGGCYATSSDGETFVSVVVPVTAIDGEGKSFCVEAQDIVGALKNLGGSSVEMEIIEDKKKLAFDYGNGRFEIPFIDSSEFPHPKSEITDQNSFSINSENLSNALRLAIVAVGDDELRPSMCGVNILTNGGKSVFAASNYKVLVKYSCDGHEGANSQFTLPTKAAKCLLSFISQSSGDVHFKSDDKRVLISAGGFSITTTLCEGKYPNYNAVIPSACKITAKASKEGLLQALRRVHPMSSSSTMRVSLSFGQVGLVISAKDVEFGKYAEEVIECESNSGMQMEVCFNCNSLIDMIKNIDDDYVAFEISDAKRAVVIRAAEAIDRETYLSIIMPIAKD